MNLNTIRGRAFTVIEVIIAVAITVVLATAVFSTTQSMTQSARRQRHQSTMDGRYTRALEILTRDLRGWLPSKAAINHSQSGDLPMSVQFVTTADSLQADSSVIQRSIAVQYSVRKVLDHFELQRQESSDSAQVLTFDLLDSADEPKMEFFDGKAWVPIWNGGDKPVAVRITAWQETTVIKL